MSDTSVISRIIRFTAESPTSATPAAAASHPFADSPVAASGFAKQSYMRAIESGNAATALGAAILLDGLADNGTSTNSAAYLEGALALAGNDTPATLIAEAALLLCTHEYRREQYHHARTLASLAEEHAGTTNDVVLQAGASAWKARILLAERDTASALDSSHRAHSLLAEKARTTGNEIYEHAAVEVTILTGMIYQQMGEYDSALTYLMEAAGLARAADNHLCTATVYTRIATILLAQQNHTQALEYCSQALHFAESAPTAEAKVEALLVMTKTLMLMKEYERLFTYAHRAAALLEQSPTGGNHAKHSTTVHRTLGRAHFAVRSYAKSLYHLQRAVQHHSKGDDSPERAALYIDIASVFRALRRYDDASVYIHHALSIADRIGNAPLRARAIRLLSAVIREQKLPLPVLPEK
ncbi:MAG: tetratricopeptide repeat protein [Candidatus Kapabacteria bacterium]|nr:tetratricopeptide repeat protein [Candidatus Kapabacteria bacterium]